MINYGTISEVKKGYAKVHFDADNIVSDWLPVLVRKSKSDKESWQLEIGEHVVCLMDERCEDGVILGAIPSDADAPDPGQGPGKFRKKFSDGTVIEYDKASKELTVDVKGKIIATALISAEITAPMITMNATVKVDIIAPLVNINGMLAVSGALTAATMATVGGGAMTSTGDIQTTGAIKTTGPIEGGTVKAGALDLGTHKHTSTAGGGPTSTPIP